jgi:hypothetical protein
MKKYTTGGLLLKVQAPRRKSDAEGISRWSLTARLSPDTVLVLNLQSCR